jgi:protein gp37
MTAGGRNLPGHPSTGLTRQVNGKHVWTGEVRENPRALEQALAWKRGRRIFWNAHGDLFHESVPDAWIDRLFAVCALTPQHTHMILTKRSERMREYMAGPSRAEAVWSQPIMGDRNPLPALAANGAQWGGETPWPLFNVWLGVSVEDQQRADERIPDLLATPAAVRFISAEPLLGPVDLRQAHITPTKLTRVDWVIAGGESGPGARPMNPEWARSLRDQCEAAGVAFHFKQWGEWLASTDPLVGARLGAEFRNVNRGNHLDAYTTGMNRIGKKRAGRLLDGRTHDAFPEARHA